MEKSNWDQLIKNRDLIWIVATTLESNGATTTFECYVTKNGKNIGRFYENESACWRGGGQMLDLPRGIHEECLARLQDSEFFQLETNEPRWNPIVKAQKPVSSIEVHFRGQKHVVKKYANIEVEEGYEKMMVFLRDVQRRSTVHKNANEFTPSFHNPTSDQLGGVISGLTPAEQLSPEINPPVRNKRD